MTDLDRPEERRRYAAGAIRLHWAIAFFVLLNLSIGPFMEGLAEPARTLVVRLHQSSGITVLVLTVLRIGYRLKHRPPPLDPGLTTVERMAAKAVHSIAYVAMVALPLSGWALISANPPSNASASPSPAGAPGAKRPKRIMLWGLVPLVPMKPIQDIAAEPGGIARQHALHGRLVRAHAVAAYAFLALILLHVLGALKHQWLDGQPELYRMGVGGTVRSTRFGLSALSGAVEPPAP